MGRSVGGTLVFVPLVNGQVNGWDAFGLVPFANEREAYVGALAWLRLRRMVDDHENEGLDFVMSRGIALGFSYLGFGCVASFWLMWWCCRHWRRFWCYLGSHVRMVFVLRYCYLTCLQMDIVIYCGYGLFDIFSGWLLIRR